MNSVLFSDMEEDMFITEMCIYKGRDYAQGQKWQDGCDYNCECTNAKMGFYRCTEK